jgi:hypothetical protein
VVAIKDPISAGTYVLVADGGQQPIPAQVFQDAGGVFLGTVLPHVGANQSLTYVMRAQPTAESDASAGVSFEPKGRNLLVALDRRPLTEYRVDVGNKPFFFPLIGPTGASYTRAYPMEKVEGEDEDHPHQRSCWFTHGNVDGIDFWSEPTKDGPDKTGKIRETARTLVTQGPVLGRLRTNDDWRAPDGRKVCDDERVVTFYRTKDHRIIDFDVVLHAGTGPVTFGDTKEGMFGLRVASSMDVVKGSGRRARRGQGRITNAEGLTDEKAWGQASPWVDYVGPVKGQTVGIAILNHPESFRYPTTWHVRTYGLFAANPFGWHDFDDRAQKGDYTVPEGQTIRFAYRVIFHEGTTEASRIPRLFDAYAKPPSLEIKAD